MSGLPLLVFSLVLVASSIVGLILWSRVKPPGGGRDKQIVELGATIALEASRTDSALDAKELALIEEAIASRVDDLGLEETADKMLNRLLMKPVDPKNAPRAVEALVALNPDERDTHFVLQVLSTVIFADNQVKPDEAYFFYKTASRLGLDKETAAKRYGIQGMQTEELVMAKGKNPDEPESFYDDQPPIGPDENPPEGSGL